MVRKGTVYGGVIGFSLVERFGGDSRRKCDGDGKVV